MDRPKKKTKSVSTETALVPKKQQFTLPEHGLLTASANNDLPRVEIYLQNPYLNPNVIVDSWGNTPLHKAALNGHFKVINKFLHDPRSNVCNKNMHGYIPQQLLHFPEKLAEQEHPELSQKYSNYAHKLFARYTLNNVVNTQAYKLLPCYIAGYFDQATITGTVSTIVRKINQDLETQDTDLPEQARLPLYATDEFIKNMLLFQLSTLSQNN